MRNTEMTLYFRFSLREEPVDIERKGRSVKLANTGGFIVHYVDNDEGASEFFLDSSCDVFLRLIVTVFVI